MAAPFEEVTGNLCSAYPGLGRWAEKPVRRR